MRGRQQLVGRQPFGAVEVGVGVTVEPRRDLPIEQHDVDLLVERGAQVPGTVAEVVVESGRWEGAAATSRATASSCSTVVAIDRRVWS